jgi:hypothetical protein
MEARAMTSDTVRAIIREVLAEELQRLKAGRRTGGAPRPQVREERVSIASDADLAAFVGRLLELARDGQARREIEDKRHVFRLAAGGLAPAPGETAASPARPVAHAARIDAGMVSERQIDALPPGTTQVIIGRSVRLTPLARDRARARGITLERAS